MRLSSAILALSSVLLVSCSDGTTAPIDQQTLDSLLFDMNAGYSYAAPAVATLGMPLPASSGNAPAPCDYQASTQRFVCPTFLTPFGSKIDRWFQLLDVAGAPLSSFDRARVAAVKTVVDIVSNRPMPGMDGPGGVPPGMMHDTTHSQQVLSGLLTNARTLNGVSTSTMTLTFGTDASETFTMTQTTKDLVLPAERGGYPKSGSITTEATMPDFLGTGSFTRTMTMTFNGSSIVTVTVTFNGTTTTCQLDLSQPMSFPNACPLLVANPLSP